MGRLEANIANIKRKSPAEPKRSSQDNDKSRSGTPSSITDSNTDSNINTATYNHEIESMIQQYMAPLVNEITAMRTEREQLQKILQDQGIYIWQQEANMPLAPASPPQLEVRKCDRTPGVTPSPRKLQYMEQPPHNSDSLMEESPEHSKTPQRQNISPQQQKFPSCQGGRGNNRQQEKW